MFCAREMSDAELAAKLAEAMATLQLLVAEQQRRLAATAEARQQALQASRAEERLTAKQYSAESGVSERTLRDWLHGSEEARAEMMAVAGANSLPRRRWEALRRKR